MSLFGSFLRNINSISSLSLNLLKNSNVGLTYIGLNKYSQLVEPLQGEISVSNEEKRITKDVLRSVNEVQKTSPCRTFAVVQICGKQFKVTAGDVIIVEGYWPPTTGDKISLDKVLLAGSKEFSLIGTPLVEQGLVNVNATIIEKALSHTKTHFRKKRRKQYMRINFYRSERTSLRINDITIGELSEDF